MGGSDISGGEADALLGSGLILTGSGNRKFRLVSYLGGGLMSEVWTGTPLDDPDKTLAIKIMAPGLDEALARRFFAEVDTLGQLAYAQDALRLKVDDCYLTPLVITESRQGRWPFFACTLASGQALDELMREGVQLLEVDVLTIAEQLSRVFQALHEGLGQSYLDFQPRNVFWDATARRITVVDWNLLSAPGQADFAADLETLARLVYRLAVGASLAPGRLDQAEGWKLLTSGTRAWLTRALHPNRTRRYASAAHMRAALAQLLSWWQGGSDELTWQAANCLNQASRLAERERRAELYQTAQHILDIADHKGVEDPQLHERLWDAVRAGLGDSGQLGQLHHLLATGECQEARQLVQRIAAEANTLLEQLAAARWQVVTEVVCQSRGRSGRDVLGQAKSLADTLAEWSRREWEGVRPLRYVEALQLSSSLSSRELTHAGLTALVGEARGWIEWLHAREQPGDDVSACKARAQAYEKAWQHVRKLPYLPLLLNLWGDLRSAVDQATAHLRQIEKHQQLVDELRASFAAHQRQPQVAFQQLRAALQDAPGDEQLTQLALDWATQLMDEWRLTVARRCLDEILPVSGTARVADLIELYYKLDQLFYCEHLMRWARSELGYLMGAVEASDRLLGDTSPPEPWVETSAEVAADRLAPAHQEATQVPHPLSQKQSDLMTADRRWRRFVGILGQLAEAAVQTRAAGLRRQVYDLVRWVVQSAYVPASELDEIKTTAARLSPDAEERAQLLAFWEAGERKRNEQHQAPSSTASWEAEWLGAQLRQSHHETQALKQQLSASQQQLNDLRRRLAASGEEIESLRQRLVASQREALELKRQLAAVQQESGSATSPAVPQGHASSDQTLYRVQRPTVSSAPSAAPGPSVPQASADTAQTQIRFTNAQLPRAPGDSSTQASMQSSSQDLDALIGRVQTLAETCFNEVPPRFQEVLEQLEQVIELVRQADGREASCIELEARKRHVAQAGATYHKFLADYTNRQWREAVDDLNQLQGIYHLAGVYTPGDITRWRWMASFEQAAADFTHLERQWAVAQSAMHRRALLNSMLEALRPVSPNGVLPGHLRAHLEVEQWIRLQDIWRRLEEYRRYVESTV